MEPRGRRTYHHGDLARALVEVAVRLVEANGVEAFSLREAARVAGVDVAAVYRHYASKSDLLAAVASEGFSLLARAMEEETLAHKGPWQVFFAIGRTYVRFSRSHRAHFRVMFGPFGAGKPKDPRVRGVGATGKDPYEIFLASLTRLDAQGKLSVAPEAACLFAWSLVHGYASLVADDVVQPQPSEGDLEALLQMAKAGIAAGG
ncbi:MAG: TetR/AcrR family transcriptional regulator [Deltaproteobacteria bacterium]|nr:TetR/AcrR family transcriptional regulator [Deltaproteobacteria bacterium]